MNKNFVRQFCVISSCFFLISCESQEEKEKRLAMEEFASLSEEEKEKRLAKKELAELGISVLQYDEQLLTSASKGSIKRVNLLLAAGADANAKDMHGNTAIMAASAEGNTEIVENLLKKGGNLGAENDKGKNALFFAVENARTEMVKFLLTKNVNIDEKDSNGNTVLHYAISRNNLRIAKLLIQTNAMPNVKNCEGVTPLYLATRDNNDEAIALLENAGATLGAPDEVLELAVRQNNVNLARKFFEASSVSTNPAKGGELLKLASSSEMRALLKDAGCIEIISTDEAVQLLLRYEIIDPYAAGVVRERINFAQSEAAFKINPYENYIDDSYRKESEQFLYNYKLCKDGQKKIRDYDFVLSIYFLWHDKGDCKKHLPLECIMAFIAAGSSNNGAISGKYDGKWNSLDYAAWHGHSQIVQALLNAGVKSKNLLQKAVISNDVATVEVLLNVPGIDVNEGDKLRYGMQNSITPLEAAAQRGYLEIVKLLLTVPEIDVNKGISGIYIGQNGTPLKWAAENGHIEVVKALLEVPEIDVNKSTGEETPLSVAKEKGHVEIVKLLKVAGAK